MAWINFTNYSKRIWDINYDGTKIHLVFVERIARVPSNQMLHVTWTTSKFKGVKFSFSRRFSIYENQNWPLVFEKLRISLAYGLNQNARQVTDRLLSVDPNKPHPIHQMVRTSRGI